MSISYTYATLKAAVIDTVEDNGTAFDAAFDNILALAEDKILKDLNLELFDTVNPLAFTASNPLLTKPTGTIATRSLHYTDANSDFQLLLPKTWEYVKDFWPNATDTTASPRYYADYSETEYYIAGTPSGTNVVTARCVVNPTGLTSVNTTTWLSEQMGDLLFYACLMASEEYLKADNRIAVWGTEYQSRLATAKNVLKQSDRMDYTPMTSTSGRKSN